MACLKGVSTGNASSFARKNDGALAFMELCAAFCREPAFFRRGRCVPVAALEPPLMEGGGLNLELG